MAWPEHNALEWYEAFKQAGDGTDIPDMMQIRSLRKQIWIQTEQIIVSAESGAGIFPGLHLVEHPTTVCCKKPAAIRKRRLGEFLPIVCVEEVDMLERACQIHADGLSVAVLCMAAATRPGGSVAVGAGAQEENFHRRSDAKRFTMDQQHQHYPIQREACLMSTNVTIFRGPEKAGYPFLDKPFKVTMLCCAAINKPALSENHCDYLKEEDREAMRCKIEAIVHAAVESKCDVVILSAFGCGAFGTPPNQVARMFREQLQEAPVRRVIFAILNDHNSKLQHNPEGNIAPFRHEFAYRDEEASGARKRPAHDHQTSASIGIPKIDCASSTPAAPAGASTDTPKK